MRRFLSIVALALAVVLGLASNEPAQAQAPGKKVVLAPGERAQGTVIQLDSVRGKLLVQTAKGTVELSDRVSVRLPDGRTVQEDLRKPRVLRKDVTVIIIRLPDGRTTIIIVMGTGKGRG
jgi:hypothetical protein